MSSFGCDSNIIKNNFKTMKKEKKILIITAKKNKIIKKNK